ncbi:FxsA family protein [Salinicola aestuarinus]|uniref:FxsA family protein n=1 Tax=Salinicola aestuarinus TaxID=1949082 RepID=UPI000DA1E0AE|nr:FxsA family protein [Salinicola aestuarinus]
MPLLLLLVLMAIADFVVLFTLGAKLGLLVTLLWIALSAAFGIHLIRRESLLTFQRARERFARGEVPSDELLHGAGFLLAGILLIAPGFLSDMAGLLCLIPGSGRLLRRWTRVAPNTGQPYGARVDASDDWQRGPDPRPGREHRRDDTGEPLEGEFVEKCDNDSRPR